MVLIAVPHTGEIKTGLAKRLMEYEREEGVEVFFNSARPVDINRNQIAEHFIEETEHDYILMVDSDVIPPTNVFEMLEDYDEDVFSPVVFSSNDGVPYPVGMAENAEGQHSMYGKRITEELVELDSIGTGCIFISREVFEEIEKPYFSFEKDEEGDLVYGEDISFCKKVRDAGFDIKMSMEYFAGHMVECDLSNMMRMVNIALTTDADEVFMQQVGDKTERT